MPRNMISASWLLETENPKLGTKRRRWAHGDLNSRPTAVLEPVVLEQAI